MNQAYPDKIKNIPMGNSQYYNQKLELIKSIPDSEVSIPGKIPVDTYLQEAENLYLWCMEDEHVLTSAGLDRKLVTDLPARAGALREAQAIYITAKFTKTEDQKMWAEKSKDAYNLRNELMHTMRFAYRNHREQLLSLAEITKGHTHADMIQDLSDLAVLARTYPGPLESVKFDFSLVNKAFDYVKEISHLLAVRTCALMSTDETMKIRNQAFTHLKSAVDEIRDYGRFVFRGNEDRLHGYRSEYLKRIKQKYKDNKKEKA